MDLYGRMVRRGRQFESVRGLCKSAGNRRFLVQADLLHVERAVGMEPFMKLSRRQVRFESLGLGMTWWLFPDRA